MPYLKSWDGRTNERTNGRTDERTDERTNLVTESLLELLIAAKKLFFPNFPSYFCQNPFVFEMFWALWIQGLEYFFLHFSIMLDSKNFIPWAKF